MDRIGCLGLGRSWFAAHAKKKEAPIDVQIHLTCLLFRSVVRSGTGSGDAPPPHEVDDVSVGLEQHVCPLVIRFLAHIS